MSLTEVSVARCFGGLQKVFAHESIETRCSMKFGVFLPPQALDAPNSKLPVLYFLSGLTCNESNFIQKSGFQRYAAENNMVVVNPDTSPRGCDIEGEEDSWDFGTGAGFYLDATEEKWSQNYRMYSYVTKELPALIAANFPVDSERQSIFGHSTSTMNTYEVRSPMKVVGRKDHFYSMGGHGALICALKNPGQYKSVSAFSPICNPMECPWGIKAFSGYLGEDRETWKQWDACELIRHYSGPTLDILCEQGDVDNFLLDGQLLPDNLLMAATVAAAKLQIRKQPGYDHSYFFIASFIEDHFKHHVKHLIN